MGSAISSSSLLARAVATQIIAATLCQTAIIDWSQVVVAEDGQIAFGPVVDVGEERLNRTAMVGFYANSDGFYGRPAHTEYLHLRYNEQEDRLEALKLVGDANVPRGQLSFRTASGHELISRMAIQLHLRDDPSDWGAFEWTLGNHAISFPKPAADSWQSLADCYNSNEDFPLPREERDGLMYYCYFMMHGPNPAGLEDDAVARFHRVSEKRARAVALRVEDAD